MLLEIRDLRVKYGNVEVLHGIDLAVQRGGDRRHPGGQRGGQIDDADGHQRHRASPRPDRSNSTAKPLHKLPGPRRRQRGRHPGARGKAHLRHPHRRGKPHPGRLRAPRCRTDRKDPAVDLRALPHPEGAQRSAGRHAVRRRAADARHRPGPHGQAEDPAPRRALARSGAASGEGHLPDTRADQQGGVTIVLVEQNARRPPSNSPTAAMSWKSGASSSEDSAAALLANPEVQKAYLGG